MTDFNTIVDRLKQGELYGDEIATYRDYIAAWLSGFYESYGRCLSFGAEWKTAKREEPSDKPKSEAELERLYLASGPGKEETHLKWKIKQYETIAEVLTSRWFQVNKEAKEAQR